MTSILVVAAYFVAALVLLVAWLLRDFEACRRRTQGPGSDAGRAAARFANRASAVLGLLGGGGAALALALLARPALRAWEVVVAGVSVCAIGALLLEAFLRVTPHLLRTDPLAELRPASALGVEPAPDGTQALGSDSFD